MSSGDAVATHEMSKRYGRETALDRVDLRVPDGAVYVLVGANGAGKSTMLKVLMNLERADSGTAEILGLDTFRRGPEARAQVGYVSERPDHAYRWMTCGGLLDHVAAYYPAWDHAYADRLSRAFGLRLQRKVGTLSKGESRRLQLVLALAHRPPVLLLDEPTDGLDPVVRNRTLCLLAEHLADTPTIESHGSGTLPLPTSLDLYRELQAVTPASLHYLLVDLFEANTFWELATERVTAEQTETGAWQVTLDVPARKVVVDTAGVETDVPMDDLIEVGVFTGDDGEKLGEALHLHLHRVRSGEQRITVMVPSKPARAGIDPRNLLIDVEGDDNLKEITRAENLPSRGR